MSDTFPVLALCATMLVLAWFLWTQDGENQLLHERLDVQETTLRSMLEQARTAAQKTPTPRKPAARKPAARRKPAAQTRSAQ